MNKITKGLLWVTTIGNAIVFVVGSTLGVGKLMKDEFNINNKFTRFTDTTARRIVDRYFSQKC